MEYVFPIGDIIQGASEKDFGKHSDVNKTAPIRMIFGSSGSCKTYLLMQAANSVADEDNKVLFVSPQRLSRLPASVHGMKQLSSFTMKHIQFLYAKDCSSLQAYLSTVHLKPQEMPSVIIVDELNHYCAEAGDNDPLGQLVLFSKISSLIQEAVYFSMSKLSSQQSEKKTVNFAMISWTLDTKESSLKLPELEDVASRVDDCECWSIQHRSKKDAVNRFFELSRQTASNEKFLLNFCLRKVNPTLNVIYLEDVFLEKSEEQSNT